MKIGLQVYSIRDDAAADFAGTMAHVKAMGYDGVELAGSYGLDAETIKRILADVGLTAISAHIPLDDMAADPDSVFGFYKTVGCRFAAVPWMPEDRRPGTSRFDETVETIRKIGAKAREYGIHLLYHNHDFEFVKLGDEYALDTLYRVIGAEYLETEIDTCWVNVAGVDPAGYVRKYTGRAPIVHLKDFFMDRNAGKEGMYELIGIDKKASAQSTFEFRCVGHGMQSFPGIIDASKDAGAEWLIVEQDRPSQGLTPMECADISRKYLKSIGY